MSLLQGAIANVVLYRAMTGVVAAVGRWTWALHLVTDAKSRLVQPADTMLPATLLKACEESGQWQWALSLLRDSSLHGGSPDAACLGIAAAACERAGHGAQ